VLVAIVKKRLDTKLDLYTLLQILSTTLFEKIALQQAFSSSGYTNGDTPSANQLQLFNF
jgi:hypothetical protein